jgi:serine/threonine protein kinase
LFEFFYEFMPLSYLPPEFFIKNQVATFKLNYQTDDMFSLGASIFALMAQELPYFKQAELNDYKYKLIANSKWDLYWKEIEKKRTFSSNFKLLLQTLICLEKCERLSSDEAIYHDWILEQPMNINEIMKEHFENFQNLIEIKYQKDLIKKTSTKKGLVILILCFY